MPIASPEVYAEMLDRAKEGTKTVAELKKQGADDIVVFVGGVIPAQYFVVLRTASEMMPLRDCGYVII